MYRRDEIPDGHHETGEEHAREDKYIDGNGTQIVKERGQSGSTCMGSLHEDPLKDF